MLVMVGGIVAHTSGEINNRFSTSSFTIEGVNLTNISAGNLIAESMGGKGTETNCYKYEGQSHKHNGLPFEIEGYDSGEVCTLESLNSEDFYFGALGWSEEIWSAQNLDFEQEVYPALK